MNFYRFKKTILTPYIWFMRWKERETTGFKKAVLEIMLYSPAIYSYIKEQQENPDFSNRVDLDEHGVVFDVGAFVGDWSKKLAELYDPFIYSFEPNERSISIFKERLGDKPKIKLLEYGLAGSDKEVAFSLKGMGSSAFDGPGITWNDNHTVSLRDIKGVMEELNIERIDLLKVNIEGGEYELLDRLIETGYIGKVKCICVQYHEWIDGAHKMRRRINKALANTHAQDWCYPFVWEQWTIK